MFSSSSASDRFESYRVRVRDVTGSSRRSRETPVLPPSRPPTRPLGRQRTQRSRGSSTVTKMPKFVRRVLNGSITEGRSILFRPGHRRSLHRQEEKCGGIESGDVDVGHSSSSQEVTRTGGVGVRHGSGRVPLVLCRSRVKDCVTLRSVSGGFGTPTVNTP